MQITRRLLTAIVLVSLCSIETASCALMGGPDLRDLKFVSVKVIDPRSPADAAIDNANPWHDRASLVVSFTAEQDLFGYVKQHEYSIGNDASFCRGNEIDSLRPTQNDPYVFDARGKLDAYRGDVSGSPASEPIYHIYIAIRPIHLAGQSVFEYDLQHAPEDVCVRLSGGNMLGGKFISNVIVVPKASIMAALAHF